MNFFDGRMLTPFLPRSKIVQVLRSKINLPLPSERYFSPAVSILTVYLFYKLTLKKSNRGVDALVHLKGAPGGNRCARNFS
jgi:hypothetical protein